MSRECRECGRDGLVVVGTGPYEDTIIVECPHCGEEFEIAVESQESHEMIQDCASCTRSVTFSIEVLEGDVSVSSYG